MGIIEWYKLVSADDHSYPRVEECLMATHKYLLDSSKDFYYVQALRDIIMSMSMGEKDKILMGEKYFYFRNSKITFTKEHVEFLDLTSTSYTSVILFTYEVYDNFYRSKEREEKINSLLE